MPELPEVETVASDLRNAGVVGLRIAIATVRFPKTIATPGADSFKKQIQGKKITGISRRGKYIVIGLSHHLTLLIHLRMTGRFILTPSEAKHNPHEHVILDLDNHQQLRFCDTRKFGRWYLVKDPNTILGKLGPEPLDPAFDLGEFRKRLSTTSRKLKPFLLDQTAIAGLGNIYVDEALWEAKLHPEMPANTLSKEEAQTLLHSIKSVLQKGLKAQGTTLGSGKSNFYRLHGQQGTHQHVLNVFRRTGAPCPRCQTPIQRFIVAQRSTHICPNCQMR